VRTRVTDAQVKRFIGEFDTKIYPRESRFFSVPRGRNGSRATAEKRFKVPAGYWKGAGGRIVTLVDNVRDENFYDTNNKRQHTYIAGFFSATLNDWLDRNVMTIDGFDWVHRTGDNPPDAPSSDPCRTAPARANLYEGTFAHEYQHLLESYADADEVNWVNEGLADHAQTLLGYTDTRKGIREKGFDGHVQCYLGWLSVRTLVNPNPRAACGPENSLTAWQDKGPAEVLADYGAAYSFMNYLADRFGSATLTALHRHAGNGLAGLQAVLDRRAPGARAQDILHDWMVSTAVDGAVDAGATLVGGRKRAYTARSLNSTVNWDSPYTYRRPGAPANGADYLRLRHKQGDPVAGAEIRSLTFDGAQKLDPDPLRWTVQSNARRHNPALFSGSADNLDRSLVRRVTVPANAPTLTFDAKWKTEARWDFGFVQVSTDGGKTYRSLPATNTTNRHESGADPRIVGHLPGFTDASGGFKAQRVDLRPYAGQTILLAFRYMSDAGTNGAGFWVDNIRVGRTLVSDGRSVAGFSSADQISPRAVSGWTLQLVGLTKDGKRAQVAKVALTSDFTRSLSGRQVRRMVGPASDTVAAIVTQDDPTETIDKQARYTLTVNGVVQPGG
jgi:hypothetical protein